MKSEIIQEHQEIKQSRVIIDPRSFWAKFWDSLQHPVIPFVWAVVSGVITLVWSGFFLISVLVFFVLWLAVIGKPDVLPIHLPMEANKLDRNDRKPSNKGFYKARGSFYIGRTRTDGSEVWASFKALTQHFLLFGTTGAGKTESIVSYIVNYLSVGSAVAFQDAKAAPKAMFQIATFCRIFGRDDDFRVTNYITGMTSTARDPAERMSNDAAVFATGNAESNTQLLVSLMPPSGGDNKIFAERAVALVAAVMPALTDLRDLGKLQIDPSVIRRYMSFKQFVALFRNGSVRKRSRDALQAFLESLPGYDENLDVAQQPEEVTRQFGFAQAYFTRSLSSLSDTYGHIYMVGQGEIDYQDAVLNGRMLMTLLPSLEKSGEELSNLGKIVLTATRNGMVVGLGTVFEGSAEDVVHNLPTNSEIPYGVMNDENAYMLVEGQEMINAQARGLGFGVLTGTQDAPGMLENISKTTKQIMANSAFKQIMYLDDKETTELAVEFSGEATVMVRNSYERDGDLGNYYAGKSASVEKRYRLTATAVKKQDLGQAYLMYQGKIHEIQVFNHGISEKHSDPTRCYLSHWYPVRMAKVKVPSEEILSNLISMSPRPEWQDLMLMLRDDARSLLKEMSTYFSSMIQINQIAHHYMSQNDNEMLSLHHTVYGAREVLSSNVEPSSGLMKDLEDHAPRTFKDTVSLFAYILKNGKSNQVAVQRMADEAGLDSILLGLDVYEDQDDASEATTSGGGGIRMKSSAEPVSDNKGTDVLADYLNGAFDQPGISDPEPSDTPEFDNPVPAQRMHADPEPKSAMAAAVQRNLVNMPWMASAVEYSQTQANLTQAEMFFNDGNEYQADQVVNEVMDSLASQLEYPTTTMKDALLSTDQIKGAIARLIGN
ncbi:TraM recognition domain-containing protein [Stutzerimonas stutzeri]|uniref:TraM recognition domain-containing protein n=1 Tax=Stutzerimonas stutzeri TaxID=316 RepID=UPI0015E3E2B9|nr:TraM recognition domain-containing protein [Stutzerimonas stutzeri]MBA1280420.1 TraM recognition domain-containing protein [Stutzerimonas stutzeri]